MRATGPFRLLGVLLVARLAGLAGLPTLAGPYIAYSKRFYECDAGPERTWSFAARATHFSPGRPRDLQHLSGNITVGDAGLDDKHWMHAVLDVRSNNQWKENAFVFDFPGKACSALRSHVPDPFRIFFGGQGMSGECFVPPGTYSFQDEPVKWVFPFFPVLPYGVYRFRLSLGSKPKATNFCLAADCALIPKI